jgi:hypothetical protein
MNELQYLLCNGRWADCGDRSEYFLQKTIYFHETNTYKKYIDTAHLLQALAAGDEIKFGNDWDDKIRVKKDSKTPLIDLEKYCKIFIEQENFHAQLDA